MLAPIPALPPVTRMTLPLRSGMSRSGWKDDGWGGDMVDLMLFVTLESFFLEAEIEARWL